MLEQADVAAPERRPGMVTFVLVGGGLAGVEVAGQLNDFVRAALRSYPNIPPREVRIVLVEAQPRLMPEVSEELAAFALAKLRERGVEVWLDTRLIGATGESARFSDGRELPTRTIVWQAGVAPSPFLAELPLQLDKRGRVVVDQYLRVPGHPGVWAIGDCASVPNVRQGGSYRRRLSTHCARRQPPVGTWRRRSPASRPGPSTTRCGSSSPRLATRLGSPT
jgi:NADH dehydrogenase